MAVLDRLFVLTLNVQNSVICSGLDSMKLCMLLVQVGHNIVHPTQRSTEIYKCSRGVTNLARGEAAGFYERAFKLNGMLVRCSGNTSSQDLERPVPRAVGDDGVETPVAGPTGNPSVVSTVAPPAADLDELRKFFPKGSVYLRAAIIDGATATDAITGWVILMVWGRASIFWQSVE